MSLDELTAYLAFAPLLMLIGVCAVYVAFTFTSHIIGSIPSSASKKRDLVILIVWVVVMLVALLMMAWIVVRIHQIYVA